MRIQHNIMAMSSYRNYTNNVSAMKANLEKLSSGYKINRAGDDAAGLAISEKMRAQITGLKQAQANAKSGINLVQTAEGALQEVQDMLNRMVKLSEQSANGTYDENVDRNQLQKEFTRLTEEIDRINQSANFNGIQLFGTGGGSSGGASGGSVDVALAIEGDKAALEAKTGTKQKTSVTFADTGTVGSGSGGALKEGDKVNVTIEMTDGTKYDFEFGVNAAGSKLTYDGKDVGDITSGDAKGAGIAAAVKEALGGIEGFSDSYTVGGSGAAVELESAKEGFGDASIKVASVSVNGKTPANAAGSVNPEGKGKFTEFDVSKAQVYDATDDDMKAEDSIFTVNGQKFAFAKDADSAKALGTDVNVVIGATASAANMVALMNQKLGTNIAAPTGDKIEMISKGGGSSSGGGSGSGSGINLQIGDTGRPYNMITVNIKSIASTAITDISEGTGLTLSQLSVATEDSARTALDAIKGMVNYISDIRGELGATQNRLNHTINNLSVMEENIQDAESTIRDTDVADEMMAYTKNNILIQSAQAMLAQANQVPQGVLQLLQ